MKIRSGFVSNSSSSSFIVISKEPMTYLADALREYGVEGTDTFVVDGSQGRSEFGWEIEDSSDFYSKLNFSYLQTVYDEDGSKGWLVMLESVLKDRLQVKNIVWNLDEGYIDHQSGASEAPENAAMFDSEESLRHFLFNSESYIHTDNDNH